MNYDALIAAIAETHQHAQAGAAGAVNRHLILRNWLIGAFLRDFEQNGEDRAGCGTRVLIRLSADLNVRGIPGTSPDMLERMRLLYASYPQLGPQISAPVARKLAGSPPPDGICAPLVRKSSVRQPTPLPAHKILELSWTHLAELVRLDEPWKRAFYENECLKANWSKRQLQRQIGSLLYERTGLSTDQHAVIEHARQQAAEALTHITTVIARLRCANTPDRTPPKKCWAPLKYDPATHIHSIRPPKRLLLSALSFYGSNHLCPPSLN